MTAVAAEPDVAELLAGIRAFLVAEVRPLEEAHRDLLATERIDDEMFALCRQVQRRAALAGYHAMTVPVEHGGAGISTYAMCCIREEVTRLDTPLTMLMLGDLPFGPNRMLLEFATPVQRERWVNPLIAGERTTAIAISEPEAGSDVTAMRSLLVGCPGGWTLTGVKHFITNAPYADFLQVLARDAAGGYTMVLVERGEFQLGARQPTMAGDDIQAEVLFDDVFVPSDRLIGRAGEGLDQAITFLADERLAMASHAVGVAQRALDLATRYARFRKTFGQPLIEHQAIQWMLADCETETRAARALVREVAANADAGCDTFRDSSMAKLFATETVGRVVDRALQVFGGVGYMRGTPIERLYRVARVLRIAGGTSELHRVLIARTRA